MTFNSICRYGTQVKIKIDETRIVVYHFLWDFPGDASGKEPTSQFRRYKRQGFCPPAGEDPLKMEMAICSINSESEREVAQ